MKKSHLKVFTILVSLAVLIFGFQNCAPRKTNFTVAKYSELKNSPIEVESPLAPIEVESPLAPIETQNPVAPIETQNPVAPVPVLKGQIYGRVKNALTGDPLFGARVKLLSSSHQLLAEVLTNNTGDYFLPDLADANYKLNISADNFISTGDIDAMIQMHNNLNVNNALSPFLRQDEIRIVTSWSGPGVGIVRDVDSYLSLPNTDPANPRASTIYFGQKSLPGANLDIDKTSFFGPETITITNLTSGIYRFYVNNYSSPCELEALGKSNILVTVYVGNNPPRQYVVPAGSGFNYELFKINNGNIVDVMQYNNSLYSVVICTAALANNTN